MRGGAANKGHGGGPKNSIDSLMVLNMQFYLPSTSPSHTYVEGQRGEGFNLCS